MSSRDRRAAARRRAWGRGPMILRFEPLEGRQLLSVATGTEPVEPPGEGEVSITSTPEEAPGSAPDANASSEGPDQAATTTAVDPAAELLAATSAPAAPAAEAVPISAPAPTPPPSPLTPPASQQARPDLVATRINASRSSLDWDERFTVSGTVANQGTAASQTPFKVDFYASPDTRIVPGAVKIGTADVISHIMPGTSYTFQADIATPQFPLQNLKGAPSYYLVMVVDATDTVRESNEANNVNRGLQGTDAMMITIRERQPARLVNAGLSIAPGAVSWGGTFVVKATVRNDANGDAPPTNARVVIAPRGDDPFGPRGYTIGSVPVPPVRGLQTVVAEQAITLPKDPPTALGNLADFVVVLVTDADDVADPVVRPHQFRGAGVDWATLRIEPKAAATTPDKLPDLKVLSVENPAEVAWGQSFTVKAKVGNEGPRNAGPFKVRFYMTQGDGPSAPTLALGDVTVPSLDPAHSREVAQTVKLPARAPAGIDPNAGIVRIVAHVNPDRALDEAKLDNNVVASAPVGLRVVGSDGSLTPVVITPAPATPQPAPQGQPAPAQPARPVVQAPQPNQGQPQSSQPPRGPQTRPIAARERFAFPRAPRADRPNLRVIFAQRREAMLQLRAQSLPVPKAPPARLAAPGTFDGPNRIA